MILNMTGGGGAELNFKVVGGTTQPASPAENTIWVNTSTTITDWIFSATQPTAAAGRVWFNIGNASSVAFNAIKKNGLWVYPTDCKQYVSGTWINKTIKAYQSGSWHDAYCYLFSSGAIVPFTTWKESTNGAISVGGTISTSYTSVSSAACCAYTTQKIDLSHFSTLKALYTCSEVFVHDSWQARIGVSSAVPALVPGGGLNAHTLIAVGTNVTLSVNITSLNGSYYISYFGTSKCNISRIWLEY